MVVLVVWFSTTTTKKQLNDGKFHWINWMNETKTTKKWRIFKCPVFYSNDLLNSDNLSKKTDSKIDYDKLRFYMDFRQVFCCCCCYWENLRVQFPKTFIIIIIILKTLFFVPVLLLLLLFCFVSAQNICLKSFVIVFCLFVISYLFIF